MIGNGDGDGEKTLYLLFTIHYHEHDLYSIMVLFNHSDDGLCLHLLTC